MKRLWSGEGVLVAALLLLLSASILYPLVELLSIALLDGGRPTLQPLLAFFTLPLFREALLNTVLSGVLAAVLGSLIGVPLALLTARYRFPGRSLIVALSVLPLAIPSFVGAAAFQQILGKSGTVNLVLLQRFGFTVPFMDGLRGVVLVQAAHSFPFIFLSTAAALAGLGRGLEEAAQSLGASGLGLFRRVVLPLALPGYVSGAMLSVVWVIDDLGAPLVLNYTALLAPQAYLRVMAAGPSDVEGCLACLILLAFSLVAFWASRTALMRGGFAPLDWRGEPPRAALGPRGKALAWLVAIGLLGPALLPQLGIVLLSVSKAWSLTPLPTGYTAGNYAEILLRSPRLIWNTLRYALAAAVADVALGAVIGWLLRRGRGPGRRWLEAIAALPLAIPGVAIAVGYLAIFHGWNVPGLGEPLTSTSLTLVIVYATRRLPFTVRGACAALEPIPIALEEAGQSLGAGRARAFVKITLPLMEHGLLAGGVLALLVSAVDLSSTVLLVPRADLAPLSYGFYVQMQSAATRGPGAALGVLAIALLAGGSWVAMRLAGRRPGGSIVRA